MFCPNCKTEYRPGFSRCSDCGAQLVEHIDASLPTNRTQDTDGPELLWAGTDPAVLGVTVNALDEAGIPHHESHRDVGPIPGLSQPVYAIFIPKRHHDAAQTALNQARREFENGPERPDEVIAATESSLAELEFPEDDENAPSVPDDVPENYDPDEATAEVWSGNDADTKDMLVACLRENGIGCELEAEDKFRIRVMPSSETRAREIVREVIEAAPPQ